MISTLVRDHIDLSPSFVDTLELTHDGSELLFVARRVSLSGAEIDNHDVTIIADEIDVPVHFPEATAITLTVDGTAGSEQVGRQGRTLRVWCRAVNRGGGRSIGQQGGKGGKGAAAADLECPPLDPDGPKPGRDPGLPGLPGLQGAKGGAGGLIEVAFVNGEPGQEWRGVGGLGGIGGDGGAGGRGCPRTPVNDGPPGGQGGQGARGDATEPLLRRITEADLQKEIVRRELWQRWVPVRVAAADVLFRGGELAAAAAELDVAAELDPFNFPVTPLTRLRHLLEHALTPFGIERDLQVVPDVGHHAGNRATATTAFRDNLYAGGRTRIFAEDDPSVLKTIAGKLRTALDTVLETHLLLQENDRLERESDLHKAQERVGQLLAACRDRIDGFPDAEITDVASGKPLAGKLLADLIDTVLAHGPAGAASLLAADLDLLATTAIRNEHLHLMPGDPAHAELVQSALGLGGAKSDDDTAVVPWSGDRAVVSFAKLRDDLRAATTDSPGLLAELGELAELAHRWRLCDLRLTQTVAAKTAMFRNRSRAGLVRTLLSQVAGLPAAAVKARLIEGVQVLTDVLAWQSQPDERALSLYTLDTTPFTKKHPNSSADPTILDSRFLFAPDPHADVLEETGVNIGTILDTELDGIGKRTTLGELAGYKERGQFVEGEGNSPVEPLPFTSENRPELLTRLKKNKNVWFDASLADLNAARFEAKVVGVGVRLRGVTSDDVELFMTVEHSGISRQRRLPQEESGEDRRRAVEHSGISRQRRLDGSSYPQHLLPATVEVKLTRPDPDQQPDVWFGAMRFSDPPDPQSPAGRAGQEVGLPKDFPLWGRGAAAGWRMTFKDASAPVLTDLRGFELEIEYDGFAPTGSVSLLRVDQPTAALVPGRTVPARAVLTGPAPAGGTRLTLASSNTAAIKLPGAVVVPEGAASVAIPVQVLGPSGIDPTAITATSPDGFSRRAVVPVPVSTPSAPTVPVRLSLRQPGEERGTVNGLAVAGKQILATYHPWAGAQGPLELAGPGSLVLVGTGLTGVKRITVGLHPRAVAVNPVTRRAYVVKGGVASSLSIVDLATAKEIAELTLTSAPVQVAVDITANLVYVSNGPAHLVSVLDGTSGAEVTRVTGIRGPQGLAVDERARRIYVAATYRSGGPDDVENGLAVIQRTRAGGHVLDRIIPLEGENQPLDVAVDAGRGLVHVANIGGGVYVPGITVIDAASLQIIEHVAVPGPLTCLDVHQASGVVYTGGPAHALHVVDGVNRRHVASHPMATTIDSVAVDQVTGEVYAGDGRQGELIRVAPVDVTARPWR